MKKSIVNILRGKEVPRRVAKATVLCAAIAAAAPTYAAGARTALFMGNSFTAGMHSPVWHYHAAKVDDLNRQGVYGVPALFELFTREAGLNYRTSVAVAPGKNLQYLFTHEKAKVNRSWDVVVMQEYSTLDPKDAGNPVLFKTYAQRFGSLFESKNEHVQVWLMATWSRPDLTYRLRSPWYGTSIDAMADDLQRIYAQVAQSSPAIKGVIPVGSAFNRAIADKFATAKPYGCLAYGEMNLWAYDNHHASLYGYYLEALMDFGRITGLDPRRLGKHERAAIDLGISPEQATELQTVAWQELHAGQGR